jgi:hypothetical protein
MHKATYYGAPIYILEALHSKGLSYDTQDEEVSREKRDLLLLSWRGIQYHLASCKGKLILNYE